MIAKAIRAAGVVAGLAAAGNAVGFALSIVIARIYSPVEFGILSATTSSAVILATIATGRYEQAIPLAERGREAITLLRLSMLCSVVFSVATLFVLVILSHSGAVPIDGPIALLAVTMVLSLSAFQSLTLLTIRLKRFMRLGLARFAYASGAGMAQIGLGLITPVAASLLIGQIMGIIVCIVIVAGSTHVYLRTRWPTRAELYRVALHYRRFPLLNAPASLFNVAGTLLPTVLIAFVFGAGEAGLFALAYKLVDAPNQIVGQAIGYVFYPDAVRLYRQDASALRRYFARITTFTFALAVVPYAVLVLFAQPLAMALFGEEWNGIGSLMAILAPASFAALVLANTTNFSVIKHERMGLAWTAASLAMLLGLFFLAAVFDFSMQTTIIALSITKISMYLLRLALWLHATAREPQQA